ncbi:glyoxalase-like protein [Bogoriella caseilytica]|uniref:Glyoxalase-like protein n=2 Tax=Bogoriella caseilytica TaxID=56055 RepID=A0A3N2BCW3_9MICO|nr:glyoxalase-like protein [Bogoriella caseilytica]
MMTDHTAPGPRPVLTPSDVRFDHAVIGVRDLDRATAALVAAGLRHCGGGEHTGRGTANSLFALAEGYLELLTVTDAELARAHSPNRAQVADALADAAVAPLGFALQVPDVAQAGAALEAAGQAVTGPVDMQRQNPDGAVLTWRNLYVGPTQWRTPFPFLITWDTPNDVVSGPEEPALQCLDLAGTDDAVLRTYALLGADTAAEGMLLAGVQVRWSAAGTGLEGIHLTGRPPAGPIGAGLDSFLHWT